MAEMGAEVLAEFLSITGAEESYALELLQCHNGDLEASLESHFAIQDAKGGGDGVGGTADSGRAEGRGGVAGANETVVIDDGDDEDGDPARLTTAEAAAGPQEEYVPPPIPARTERLVEDHPEHRSVLGARSGVQEPVNSPQNPFRQQTPPPSRAGTSEPVSTVNSRSLSAEFPAVPGGGLADGAEDVGAADSALSALYAHPADLNYTGNFNMAMQRAQDQNRWLLVNIQSPEEFKCQVLNRDLWRDENVKTVVKDHFVFWQRDQASPEGRMFQTFYTVNKVPLVAIIDPRSGERVLELCAGEEPLLADKFFTDVFDFLSNNDIEDFQGRVRVRSGMRPKAGSKTGGAGSSSAVAEGNQKPEEVQQIDADEELAKAIAQSMEDANPSAGTDAERGSASEMSRLRSRMMSEFDPKLREERSERETQDMEYEMSLAADRAREESRQMEEDRTRKAQEEERQREEASAEERRRKLERLPAEPPVGTAGSTSLVIRMPDGSRLKRRFMGSDMVQHIFDMVYAEIGLQSSGYELMTQFPRKVFTDGSQTLEEAALCPNASLIVHQL